MLRFALTYGFRNIQTLLRKLKPGLSQYDYVEVMACPSGCVNGGGQLPPAPGVNVQDSIANVSAAYHHPQVSICLAPACEVSQGEKQWLCPVAAVKGFVL